MICRLCLSDSINCLPIFIGNDDATETEIAKIIAKYLHIELQLEDAVSKHICTSCCTHLQDFHAFCTIIEEKQHELEKHNVDCTDLKPDKVSTDVIHDVVDIKYTPLCEPQIDATELNASVNNYDLDDDAVDGLALEDAFENCEASAAVGSTSVTHCLSPQISEAEDTPKVKRTRRVRSMKNQRTQVAIKKRIKSVRNSQVKNKASASTAQALAESDAFIAAHMQLKCALCAVPLNDFKDLKKHFRTVHQCAGYVECCNNRYDKRIFYIDHLKQHKNSELFKCNECGKVLISRNSLKNHMLVRHPRADELNFQCTLCPRKFPKKYLLDVHAKIHRSAATTHTCDICNKSYATIYSLKNHEKIMHLNAHECIVCDICGKNLKNKANLMYHQATMHQDVHKKQCEVCQKWLKNARSLKKHMLSHLPEETDKEYVCKICGMVKPTRVTLDSHIRYHHSKASFKCELCGKDFKYSLRLKEHLATHTGEDLYTCAFCPRTFKSQANMYKHRRTVHQNEVAALKNKAATLTVNATIPEKPMI